MLRPASPTPLRAALSLAFAALAATGPAVAQSADAPPSVPGNVRATLYPGAGGEVLWQRSTDDRGVRGYEVTRNGTSLGIRDALSFYDPSLRANTAYTFTVATASIGGATPTPGPTTPTNPMAPVPPTSSAGPIRTGATEIGGDFPVRLAVYDGQSFELSWQRVPGAVTYRLQRDGRTVQESNGVSRYVSGVNARATFAYTLVALDRSGMALRTARFTVQPAAGTQLVAGGSTSTPTTTPTVNDGPIRTGQTSLAGDIGVRLGVYDAKAYELFWDRVPGAVRYRLTRGGQVVQESDAVSRFVGSADSTRRFDYTLMALDRSGNVLRTRAFTVAPRGTPQLAASGGTSTPANPTPPPSTTGDLPAVVAGRLATVFRVAGGDALETLFALESRLSSLAQDGGLTLVSSPPSDGFPQAATYRCPRGGTVAVDRTSISGQVSTTLATDACAIGPYVVNGELSDTVIFSRGTLPSTEIRGGLGYALTDTRDGSTTRLVMGAASTPNPFTGLPSAFDSADRDGLNATNLTVSASPDGAYSVASFTFDSQDQNTDVVDGRGGLTLSLRGLTGADLTDATVTTTTPFRRPGPSANYTVGALRLAGGTGYVYDLDADDGDPATFMLTVRENGSTTSYTVPWSTAFGFDRFDPFNVTDADLGLQP